MKYSTLFIYLFIFCLMIFFWRNIDFWMKTIIFKEEPHDTIRALSVYGLWGCAPFVIALRKRWLSKSMIHTVAVLWFVSMLITLIYNGATIMGYLTYLFWPILFEVIYVSTIIKQDIDRLFHTLFIVLVILGMLAFAASLLYNDFDKASNMVYFVILAIPLILATGNHKMVFLWLIFASVLAIASLKRSMMLAMMLFWFIYFCAEGIKKLGKFKSFLLILFIGIGAYQTFLYIDDLSGNDITRRMESDDATNGREVIYDMTLWMIATSSTDNQLLGHGQDAVKRDSPMDISAHNEWLEILYDYGAIALFIYILLWVYMLRKWLRLWREGSRYFLSYTLCICIWAVMSMVSQLIVYVSYVLYLFMFLAFVEAKTSRNRQ